MYKLDTTLFMKAAGTVTSINILGNNLYFTQLSSSIGSKFVPIMDKDYAEIKKISLDDFFSGDGISEVLLSIPGQIDASCLSADQEKLYFINRRLSANKKVQSFLSSFDLASGVMVELGPYNGIATRLEDIEGKYLAEFGAIYIQAKAYEESGWHSLLPNIPARRSVFFQNGNVYYMLDNDVYLIPKTEFLSGSFKADLLFQFKDDDQIGNLFVDGEGQAYATAYADNPPFLLNLNSRQKIPLSDSPIKEAKRVAQVFFKYGDTFYCDFWAADAPLKKDRKIVQITGDTIRETEKMPSPVTFLGVVGDYLVFNNDRVFKRHSDIFGIKFK